MLPLVHRLDVVTYRFRIWIPSVFVVRKCDVRQVRVRWLCCVYVVCARVVCFTFFKRAGLRREIYTGKICGRVYRGSFAAVKLVRKHVIENQSLDVAGHGLINDGGSQKRDVVPHLHKKSEYGRRQQSYHSPLGLRVSTKDL